MATQLGGWRLPLQIAVILIFLPAAVPVDFLSPGGASVWAESDSLSRGTGTRRESSGAGLSEMSEMPLEDNGKIRPPQPSGKTEENHYPTGFLTLSTPSPDSEKAESAEGAAEKSKKEEGVGQEKKSEDGKRADSPFVLGAVVAMGLFLVFAYSDHRHRTWLQTVLAQNSRLLAGEEVLDLADHDLAPTGFFAASGAESDFDFSTGLTDSFLNPSPLSPSSESSPILGRALGRPFSASDQ